MERWEWLVEPKTGIFQDPDLGCFTEDSIALVHFARIGKTDAVLDLGTGNGILCLYAETRYGGTYTGVDVDAAQIALARQSAERNGQAIRFCTLRAEDTPEAFGHGTFSRVLMNPPYFTDGDPGRREIARHAEKTLLADWCRSAFLVLKNGGTLTFCYPAEQLAAAFRALERERFAPKRIKLVMSGARARLALIEAKKLGADGLTVTVEPDRRRMAKGEEPIGGLA